MSSSKISGVYLIVCSENKKVYVGSAVSVRGRFASHLYNLRHNKHQNKHLQNAFNLYGGETFNMELIESCAVNDLIAREQAWIDHFDAANPEVGMNNSPTASTSKGFRHSEATKQRLSDLAKSRDHSRLRELSNSMRGKPAHNRGKPGKPWSDEQKQRASLSRRGQIAWNKGIKHSDETKRLISISTSIAKTKYQEQDVQRIIDARSSGMTWEQISKLTGISLAQCNRIGRGVRKVDAIKASNTYEKTVAMKEK